MSEDDRQPQDENARRLQGAMLEQHSAFAAERMPGLAVALQRFIGEAPRQIEALVIHARGGGTIEPIRTTMLFQAIGDCADLTAAVYACADPQARFLIALDERIDDLIVASIFGEGLPAANEDADGDAPREWTPIETALVEEFARAFGRALELAFAPVAPLTITFEELFAVKDAFALGRKDMPAVAARFSLPMASSACEGLLLFPQSFLLPLRKELEHEPEAESPDIDRRWSLSMESGVKRTMLPVVAVLEETSLTLGDIAGFRIGSVLPLASRDFDAIRLECSGRPMFRCKLGQGDGRYRLEIEVPINPEPVTSEPSLRC